MALKNTLVFQGNYAEIKNIRNELQKFIKNKKSSNFYDEKTTKYIKKITIDEEKEHNYDYRLKVTFLYKKNNYQELLNQFDNPQLTIAHMIEDEKKKIWIVNNKEYIEEFKLIPRFAMDQILYEYMQYKESAIILDSFERITYDQNKRQVVVNDKLLEDNELLDILFNKTIKGKRFYDILDHFINNYHHQCINQYEELYSSNKETISSEEPSPTSLFIVTFGVIGIIFLLVFLMGYI